ncbi:MAG TPA: carboxypeptidase-like regulatory domain-containing protein [Planctomycetota bacterium]|nr:carboxypeptidase-like regulatory domain-containing protein [Planctomycetota bacterium]
MSALVLAFAGPLRETGTIRGVVVDDDGRPVPHARVNVWEQRRFAVERDGDELRQLPSRTIEADETGAFSVDAIVGYALLEAAAPGMAPVQCLEGSLRAGEIVSGRRLRLGAASSIRGRVVGTTGLPLAKCVVTARKEHWGVPTTGLVPAPPLAITAETNADGAFQLEPLTAGSWWVSSERTTTGNWAGWVEAGGPALDILLEPPFAVSCTIVGTDGSPVPDGKLLVEGSSLSSKQACGGWTRVQADGSGHASIPVLWNVDDAAVGVVAPGHALAVWQNVQLRREMSPIEFSLQPELLISGTVVDEHGSPESGAFLYVDRLSDDGTELVDTGWRNRLGAFRTDCGMKGQFVLHHLTAADYFIQLTHPATPYRHSYATASAGATDLQLQLVHGDVSVVTVSGRFRDAVTGGWIFQAFVWLEAESPGPLPRGAWMPGGEFSQFESEYRIEGAPPGRYTLCAQEVGDAHARWSGPVTEFGAGRYEIDIDLHPARTLALRVTTPDGKPIGGATVGFITAEGAPVPLAAEPQGDGTIGVTDRFGEIVGTRLPATVVGVVLTPPASASTPPLEPVFMDLSTYSGEVVEIVVPEANGR